MGKEIDDLNTTLQLKQEEFEGDDSILGLNVLTFAPYIDSARCIMFGNHLPQRVVPTDTEFPRVFTNYCNLVGENGSYNQRAKSELEVVKIIKKFSQLDTPVQPKLIFVYDTVNNIYDIIYRKEVENLPEKYGFEYDNTQIDKMQVGDLIHKGDTLARPTSYDEFDNYGYGKNVRFMYLVDNQTIEDAIVVSESLAKTYQSSEVEMIRFSYNDNNVMLNSYGDNEHYKCFPDVGEMVKDRQLCTVRIVNNSQLMFDLKSSNTRRRMSDDVPYHIEGQVVDMNIFCNKPRNELIRAEFNQQVLQYLDMSDEFYTEIRNFTQQLIDSGANVTPNIKLWNKKSKEILDPEYKIKDENNSTFGNIVMYFLVKRHVGLSKGQKISGRFGNKGVIAKIRPDHMMPHLETGDRVDIIFNTLGVINRLNVFQLFEQSITFITNRVLEKIKETNRIIEKEKLFFKVISIFNQKESEDFYKDYKDSCTTKKQKEEYFAIVQKYGIYIHIEPFWHPKNLYDCLDECYATFPWLEKYTVFFYEEISKRWVPMINKQIVGEMYVMKLKQSSKKGLSARSTGPISRKGVPEKTDNAKKHIDPYSKIPVRLGVQELMNRLMSLGPDAIVTEDMLCRTSVIGRRELATQLLENAFNIKKFELKPNMTNRNVEILSAYLKVMGLELKFDYDILDESDSDPNGIKTHRYNGQKYFCTTDEMKHIIARDIAEKQIEESKPGAIYIGPATQFENFVDEVTQNIEDNLEDYL